MLNLALTAVKTAMENIDISGTPLIEKYGGLVIPLTVKEEISKTASGDPILKDKTYPVSCGVNFQQCILNRKYQELVPNTKYRSLAYWEQLGDAVQYAPEKRYDPKGNRLVFDIPVRLVVWLNIQKMNINSGGGQDCSITAPVMLKISDILHNSKQHFLIPDAFYNDKAKVEFLFQGQEVKDANRIFGKWSYDSAKMAALYLWPFDWFSLKYTVRFTVKRNCLDALTIGAEVVC